MTTFYFHLSRLPPVGGQGLSLSPRSGLWSLSYSALWLPRSSSSQKVKWAPRVLGTHFPPHRGGCDTMQEEGAARETKMSRRSQSAKWVTDSTAMLVKANT